VASRGPPPRRANPHRSARQSASTEARPLGASTTSASSATARPTIARPRSRLPVRCDLPKVSGLRLDIHLRRLAPWPRVWTPIVTRGWRGDTMRSAVRRSRGRPPRVLALGAGVVGLLLGCGEEAGSPTAPGTGPISPPPRRRRRSGSARSARAMGSPAASPPTTWPIAGGTTAAASWATGRPTPGRGRTRLPEGSLPPRERGRQPRLRRDHRRPGLVLGLQRRWPTRQRLRQPGAEHAEPRGRRASLAPGPGGEQPHLCGDPGGRGFLLG